MTRQSLSDEDRKEVVLYRLEKAERTYNEAATNIQYDFVEVATCKTCQRTHR